MYFTSYTESLGIIVFAPRAPFPTGAAELPSPTRRGVKYDISVRSEDGCDDGPALKLWCDVEREEQRREEE